MAWIDPVKSTRDFLMSIDELQGIAIGTTVPEELPQRFVRLVVTGERRRTIVHRDTLITIECWDLGGEQSAAELMETVYQALDDWDYVPTFDGWAGGPYLQPDPDHGTPRMVATVVIRHRTD